MRISPVDISNKNFSKKVMGLDAQEVYEFLRDVADQMEELVRERNRLKEECAKKDTEMLEYKERDQALRATIQAASKMSEQFRHDAEREADLIINDARQRSEVLIKDARDSLKRMYHEIADLKKSRMHYETNLRAMMESHLTMLDQSRTVFTDPMIAPPRIDTVREADEFSEISPSMMGNA